MKPFASIMSADDLDRLKKLSIRFKKREVELQDFKNTLSNILRRSYDITAIMQKLHRRVDQEEKDCLTLISEIKQVLGETKEEPCSIPTQSASQKETPA